MSDSDQYNEECAQCNCKLTEDVHIFCLSRGDEEQVCCADCVHSFWQDLKSEGWIADNDTWSELGFDDGGNSDDDPHYADCSYLTGKKCNCGAEGDDDESDDDSVIICSARCERPATTVIINKIGKDCPVCQQCKEQMSK